jgi:signal transduction histidine kinase
MMYRDQPIKRKLRVVILSTCGAVLLLTCAAFFAYEFLTFRQTTTKHLATLGEVIAANSNAAMAFDAPHDAKEVLATLRYEPHIVEACLYNKEGKLFSDFSKDTLNKIFPDSPGKNGFRFQESFLVGYQPVTLGDNFLGTLYLKSDLGAMYDRMRLYGTITALVIIFSLLLAYFLSKQLQKRISEPILELADTARAVSDLKDYSVRAPKAGNDELGLLTNAFNHMLEQIQKQNEEILSFSHELEDKVTKRTIELTDSLGREQELSEMKSRFVSMASHEFRTPLSTILSSVSLIEAYQKPEFEDKRLKHTQRIKGCIVQLVDILNNFLSLDKLEYGKIELNKEIFDIDAFARDVLESIHGTLKKGQIFEYTHSGDTHVLLDKSILRNVLLNLLSNAVKYSGEGSTVYLNLEVTEDKVCIRIKDEGIGIPEEDQKKLFGKYYRARNASNVQGTGLGLNIVKRYIDLMDGSIKFTSVANHGSTFIIEFPLNKTV